eukprot:CAMPEP_0174916234 /NCGR_PEP_ID=MMETSP1355-20121228/1671_1 /TAXON_ID=464990 /ORGANISM="Hemiselmis tepida, Strain CCMP443" /LENGTH=631 /DNA_ID=CAMNT_0016161215 /DNA_START=136 /DNA_END=2028 /DNA_ORIENTATION=+
MLHSTGRPSPEPGSWLSTLTVLPVMSTPTAPPGFRGRLPSSEESEGGGGGGEETASTVEAHHRLVGADSSSGGEGGALPLPRARSDAASAMEVPWVPVVVGGEAAVSDGRKSGSCGSGVGVTGGGGPSCGEGRAWVPGKQYSVLPGVLSFMSIRSTQRLKELEEWQQRTSVEVNCVFVSLKPFEEYVPFCADFGPLSMGTMSRFFCFLAPALEDAKASGKRLVLYTDSKQHNRTNTATMIASFLVLQQGYTAHDAWQPFHFTTRSPFASYRDASFDPVTFSLSPLDILEGLEAAKARGVFDLAAFDHDFYERCQEPATADCTEVVPGRFVAFKGPHKRRFFSAADGIICLEPKDYFETFRKIGVQTIVRLNEANYDARDFTDAGFRHYECFFPDCTTPHEGVLEQFFNICRESPGVIAIHCKAGLGRTGLLIGAWLMRKHGFTGRQAIGYCRVMRPGSILGLQQEFLDDNEALLWRMGDPDLSPDRGFPGGGSPARWRCHSAGSAVLGSPLAPVQGGRGSSLERDCSPQKPGPVLRSSRAGGLRERGSTARPPPRSQPPVPAAGELLSDSFGRRHTVDGLVGGCSGAQMTRTSSSASEATTGSVESPLTAGSVSRTGSSAVSRTGSSAVSR